MCGYQINKNTKEGQEKGKNKDHNYLILNLLCLSVSKWWNKATSAVPCCECSCNFYIIRSSQSYWLYVLYIFIHWTCFTGRVISEWLKQSLRCDCAARGEYLASIWCKIFIKLNCFPHLLYLLRSIQLMRHHLFISCSWQ